MIKIATIYVTPVRVVLDFGSVAVPYVPVVTPPRKPVDIFGGING